jgi:NADH dehydrogenase
MQAGLYAGRRIRRELEGQPPLGPFKYLDLGQAAYISRGSAVVSAGPLRLSGFTGWVVWLFIHIGFLTGYRNRVGAILTWLLAFSRDLRRERTYTTRSVGAVQDVYQLYSEATADPPKPPAQRTAPAEPGAPEAGPASSGSGKKRPRT